MSMGEDLEKKAILEFREPLPRWHKYTAPPLIALVMGLLVNEVFYTPRKLETDITGIEYREENGRERLYLQTEEGEFRRWGLYSRNEVEAYVNMGRVRITSDRMLDFKPITRLFTEPLDVIRLSIQRRALYIEDIPDTSQEISYNN